MSKTAATIAIVTLLTRIVDAIATRKQQRRERRILRLREKLAQAEAEGAQEIINPSDEA